MKIFHKILLVCIIFSHLIIDSEFIVLQSTTHSRLSHDFILPKFDKKLGIEVRVIAVGTDKLLKIQNDAMTF